MHKHLLTALVFFALTINSFAQNNNWSKWEWLLGQWQGVGSGQAGDGNGTFTFSLELDKKVMVRKSHSEYQVVGSKTNNVHDDLMVIYPDVKGNPSKAIYFDNEGHTINYNISFSNSAKSIVFLSAKVANTPVFRLTYTLLDNKEVNTKFEISRDGSEFMNYTEGNSKKVK